MENDTVYRQDAIDALADYIHNVNKWLGPGLLSPSDCKDAAQSVLEALPSAQPEQITCKDCNHCTFNAGAKIYCDELDMRMYQWDYCSRAERREEYGKTT